MKKLAITIFSLQVFFPPLNPLSSMKGIQVVPEAKGCNLYKTVKEEKFVEKNGKF